MNKSAREMFEGLGFKFEEEKRIYNESSKYEWTKQVYKHDFIYKCNSSINYKYSWLEIRFDLLRKGVHFYQNTMGGGNPVPLIEMDLLQAINKQVEELGWIDLEVY